MKDTLIALIGYLKHPLLQSDTNTNFNYRFKVFVHFLILSLATGLLISPIFIAFEHFEIIDMNNHKVEDMLKDLSVIEALFVAAIIAPLLEELMFRAPITAFKNPKIFGIVFYVFAILFGYVHLTNYDITPTILLLSPVLVLPQLLLGLYLGFLRVRFGLIWAMALHALYNGIFVSISFTA